MVSVGLRTLRWLIDYSLNWVQAPHQVHTAQYVEVSGDVIRTFRSQDFVIYWTL